jgi:hypothetical protein
MIRPLTPKVKQSFGLTSFPCCRIIVHMLTVFQQHLDNDDTIKPCQNDYALAGLYLCGGIAKLVKAASRQGAIAGSNPAPALTPRRLR